jgi:hypothetical protein
VTDSKPGDRSYKRSWKNLLINKGYQLRFTLFMVGLAALLMVGLGVWVMWVANETTEVSTASVRGEACPKVPSFGSGAPTGEDEDAVPPPSMKLDEPTDSPPGDSPSPAAEPSDPGTAPPPAPPAPAGEAKADGKPQQAPTPDSATADAPVHPPAGPDKTGTPRSPSTATRDQPRRVNVQIDESSMTLTQAVPPDLADRFVAYWTCELRQVATFDRLERGRLRILWAMIVTGIVLVIGLAMYGIKTTHRVAGPLFKVSLYLSKMREGRFDKVFNLRKGDQLIEFYNQFKLAHGGIVAMQQDDIDRIAAVIAAAEAAGVGDDPVVGELREMLARKEKSIA